METPRQELGEIRVPQQDPSWPGLEQVLTVHPAGEFEHLRGPVVCSTLDGFTLWLIDREQWLELRAEFDKAFDTADTDLVHEVP